MHSLLGSRQISCHWGSILSELCYSVMETHLYNGNGV